MCVMILLTFNRTQQVNVNGSRSDVKHDDIGMGIAASSLLLLSLYIMGVEAVSAIILF